MLRRILGNLALALGGIVAGLLIAEVAVRISGLGETTFYIFDSQLGWRLRPGAQGWQRDEGSAWVSINREGFRGPEVALNKPPDTARVVILGDSFTEAQQVAYEDTFAAVVQQELASCPSLRGKKIEVLNLGCDGYGTAQERIAMSREAARFSPDVVVLAIFTGNDIRNNSPILEGDQCRPFFVHRGGALALDGPFAEFTFRMGCMARFESRHIQVLNLLGKARSAIRAHFRKAATRTAGAQQIEPGIDDLIYMPPRDPVWNEAWSLTEDEIEAVNREALNHGARFVAITLSNPIQDHPEAAVRQKYQRRLGIDDLFYPDRRIAELGARKGFAVLNLAAPLLQYAQANHVCLHGFPNASKCGGHWNPLGHRLAGSLIAARICAMLSASQ